MLRFLGFIGIFFVLGCKTEVNAPGVKVKVGPDGVNVTTPGATVKAGPGGAKVDVDGKKD